MNIIFNKVLSLFKPLWSPVLEAQPHMQLWRPFFVFSFIEITFRILGYSVSSTSYGVGLTEFFAYFLRIVFEVSLLAQLALILKKQPQPTSIFYFPFEITNKVIFSRILLIAAFFMPLLILVNVFGLQPSVDSPGFSLVLTYVIFTLWIYFVVYFLFAWWFNTWAIVYENQGPVESFRTSFTLTRKHWFATAWFIIQKIIRCLILVLVIGTLLAFALGSAANGIGHLIQGTSSTEIMVVNSVQDFTGYLLVKILLGFPLQGYVAVAVVSQYFNLQQQRELELEEEKLS